MLICGDSSLVEYPVLPGEGGSIPTSPLQFRFERIKNKRGAELNAQWHSVLPSLPVFHIQFAFAAIYEGRPYAVGLWGRPVARTICNMGYLELRRMAICSLAPKNTASRMLRWMKAEITRLRPDIIKLISYQDTRHHQGIIYKAAGWHPVDMKSSPVNWGGFSQTKTAPSRMRKTKILAAPKIRWEININR